MSSRGNEDLSDSPRDPATLSAPTEDIRPKVVRAPAPAEASASSSASQVRDPRRYQLLGEHGRGGLGRVSRAHDRELGRDIAIKELLSRGNVGEARFLREALITARLEHPGIVPVYEAGRWPDGTPFYAMKLVSGRSLRELLAERTTVEDRIGLLHHVIAVADAIAYAHGRNIIHRDLKPANVIVGEFGETIVIDWGLAKDLGVDEGPMLAEGPFRASPDDSLTIAGSVLGTPAYMAPEQKRAEPVDQRADVYAIGVMLWELCAFRKAPPGKAQQRHRMLRGAGIDRDLATIIDKALDPEPSNRYHDAGALAADLKAFKSGARIAARSYSLYAMLAHWTRRHRALALSAVAAIAVAVAGSLVYIRNIAAERDRADASEDVAKRARAAAETSLDELTLKHAELLLTTDPSAARDALAGYGPSERGRVDQIRAEAAGRGVALLRALPHTDNVLWTEGTADGGVLSLSNDGTIARTSRDGTSVVVARGVSKSAIASFSPARHLLAYACDPAQVCLFDAARAVPVPAAEALRDTHVSGLAFSPDGGQLAVISQESVLRVFDLADPARPALAFTRPIPGGVAVLFIDDKLLAVVTAAGIEFLRTTGEPQRFPLPGFMYWDASPGARELVYVTGKGEGVLFQGWPVKIAARAELCRGPVSGIQFIPGRRSAAYVCREGTLGIWDLEHNLATPRAQLEGHADQVAASPTGDYIVAYGGNGAITLIDLRTDLVSTYRGHGFRLTSLTPPTRDHPFVISADAGGAVRTWPLPPRIARVVATSSSSFHTAVFDPASTTVVATTWLPSLTTFSTAAGVHEIGPHDSYNLFLAQSRDRGVFATYGLTDRVELWSARTMTRTRVIATGHGSVAHLAFVGDGADFITAGHDGRLVRWTPAGQETVLTKFDQPIDKFVQTSETGPLVFSTVDGALWRTELTGRPAALRDSSARVNRLLTIPDLQTLYVGYASGDVVAVNTNSWEQELVLHGRGAVREIEMTDDRKTIAVATNDGTIQIGTRGDARARFEATSWTRLAARAHHMTLTSGGMLVVACTDGAIWLYSTPRQRALYLPTGAADFGATAATADGKVGVVLDREGRLLWIDLEAASKLLDASGSPG
ncbi:MAG TPA: WD40 repeat domain-containing serine/threonine-protein kinase [Kofleriaceae bacterium]|nr:WD40 repeat domain-containing serine/threonine-protein kinase [Kofleriaceae bacterium]